MDQKTPSTLDPKLKEVYDRVMNTKVTPQTAQATPLAAPQTQSASSQGTPTAGPSTPPPSPVTNTSPKSAVDYAGLTSQFTPPQTPASGKPTVVTPSSTTYGVVNTDGAQKITDKTPKNKSGMKIILIALGIFVFFLVYTIVWFVVFGMELPFALPV